MLKETRSKQSIANTKHGLSRTPEYRAWQNMKDRCYNKNSVDYNEWGGRGIKVCDRWLDKDKGFINFITDMGMKLEPKRNYSIERRENAGNYEPSNCYWATAKEQANNRRKQKSKEN